MPRSFLLKPFRAISLVTSLALCLLTAAPASAQFNPNTGQWGKDDPNHVRVMTWNVRDGICSTNVKTAARLNWAGTVRIIASLQPDVIIIQEAGDNSANGTGSGVDSAANLATTFGLLIRGGADPFNGGNVGIYVQQFAPTYDLPYVFASLDSDGFNRNVIASRWPLADLNNSGFSTMSNFTVLSSPGITGGDGGVRGFMTAEIDLPNDIYAGDLVVGNSHLKCCGSSSDLAERLRAAQNIAYFIDYYFNGAGTGNVDPNNRVFLPVINRATMNILDENTPVIWGGDWNEDENTNGRKGPAEWMARFILTGGTDGTDRDRTDSMYDDARDFFQPSSRTTFGSTGSGGSKLDYIAWQDSIATLHRSFIFNTATIGLFGRPYPAPIAAAASPSSVSGQSSDHRPVVIDFILPLADIPSCPCDIDGSGFISVADYFAFLTIFFEQLGGTGSADISGDGVVAVNDYFEFLTCFLELLNQDC